MILRARGRRVNVTGVEIIIRMSAILSRLVPLVAIAAALALSGCTPRNSAEWETIGVVDILDFITRDHVTNLLKRANIESSMEGSVTVGVDVPEKHAARALQILKADAKARPYNITIYDGDKLLTFEFPDSAKRTIHPRLACDKLLKQPSFGPKTDIGVALRHADMKASTKTFPYIKSIEIISREYVGRDGLSRTGHKFTIDLVESLTVDRRGGTIYFQIWDGGKRVEVTPGSSYSRDPE